MTAMLSLRRMTLNELSLYVAEALPRYAEQKRIAEGWTEHEALEIAQAAFNTLPEKYASPDHFFYSLVEDTTANPVGMLWWAIRERGAGGKEAYLYEIWLSSEARRKGHGRRAMGLLEDEVRRQGLSTIRLHVFGHNQAARNLYEKLGYRTTNVNMEKTL